MTNVTCTARTWRNMVKGNNLRQLLKSGTHRKETFLQPLLEFCTQNNCYLTLNGTIQHERDEGDILHSLIPSDTRGE